MRVLRWTDTVSLGFSHGLSPGSAPHHQPPATCVTSFSGLSWSDSHAAVYTAHLPAPALHRPSPALPSHTLHVQEATPGPQRKGFFAVCPHQPFQLFPTPIWYSTVLALWGSFLTPVYKYWPLCPRAREQCARTQKEDGRRDLPFPPAPPGGAVPSVFPQPSMGALDHLWVYPPLEAVIAGRCLSPTCSVPDPCTCYVFFQGCFPRESQGSHVFPSKTAAPLLFLQSTHHGLTVLFLYSFSVSPFYTVESNVCFLDLRYKSREWHLSKPLLIEWMKVRILNYLYPLYHGMCLLLTQPLYSWVFP